MFAIILSISDWQPVFLFSISGRLMSHYKHTDSIHNSGVVWGRMLHIHPALLQQVEVTVSVATEWDEYQVPLPTTGKINQHRTTVTHSGKIDFHQKWWLV